MYSGKMIPFYETDKKVVIHEDQRKKYSDILLGINPKKPQEQKKKVPFSFQETVLIAILVILLSNKSNKDVVLIAAILYLIF